MEIKALLFLRCSCTTWRLAIKRTGLTLSKILWRLEGHGRRDTRVKTAPEWSTVHCTTTRHGEPGTSESSPRPIVELTTHCSALSLQLKPRALLLLLPPVCIVLSVINHWRGNSATSPWLSPSSCSAGRFHLRSGTFRLYLPSLRSSLALFPSSPKCLYLGRLKYLDLQYAGCIGAHLICIKGPQMQQTNKQTMKKKFQKGMDAVMRFWKQWKVSLQCIDGPTNWQTKPTHWGRS